MKQVQSIDDVYPAVEELIAELRPLEGSNLAAILDHRMHRVAWTDRSELFEELQKVLAKALKSGGVSLPEIARNQMRLVLEVIEKYLTNNGRQ
jgi:hypothetical protein